MPGSEKHSDNEHGLGAAMCFTGGKFAGGWADSPSLDQAIADFQYHQVKTQFRSLSLGVNSSANSGHTAVFYSKGGTPITPQKSPQATFDQLFRGSLSAREWVAHQRLLTSICQAFGMPVDS